MALRALVRLAHLVNGFASADGTGCRIFGQHAGLPARHSEKREKESTQAEQDQENYNAWRHLGTCHNRHWNLLVLLTITQNRAHHYPCVLQGKTTVREVRTLRARPNGLIARTASDSLPLLDHHCQTVQAPEQCRYKCPRDHQRYRQQLALPGMTRLLQTSE